MKLVIAVIKPFKLDEVRDALVAVGVHGMTANAFCSLSLRLHNGLDTLQTRLLPKRRGCVQEIIDRLFGMRNAVRLTCGDQGDRDHLHRSLRTERGRLARPLSWSDF